MPTPKKTSTRKQPAKAAAKPKVPAGRKATPAARPAPEAGSCRPPRGRTATRRPEDEFHKDRFEHSRNSSREEKEIIEELRRP